MGRNVARRELNSIASTGDDMAKYIKEKIANQYRDMGGKLETDDELELFRILLLSYYNSIRDRFFTLPVAQKTYKVLKRKCAETYDYMKRDGRERAANVASSSKAANQNQGPAKNKENPAGAFLASTGRRNVRCCVCQKSIHVISNRPERRSTQNRFGGNFNFG